jgi:hypothetical protein
MRPTRKVAAAADAVEDDAAEDMGFPIAND